MEHKLKDEFHKQNDYSYTKEPLIFLKVLTNQNTQ